MLRYFYTVFFLALFPAFAYSQSDSSNTYHFNSAMPISDSVVKESAQQRQVSPTGDLDSLKFEILRLRNDLTNLRSDFSNTQVNLMLSHRKYKKGALILGAGIAAMFLAIISPTQNGLITSQSLLLYVGGFGAVVTGNVIMITSHKYIGKAGVNLRRYSRTSRFRE